MQAGFDFRGLRCFPSAAGDGSWHFLPLAPDVQRGADHRPMMSFVDLGTSAYLLFTATWAPAPEDLEALRAEIARRTGEADIARITLSFAPIAAPRCNALVGNGSGAYRAVASSDTSGMPPYNAVFNLFLQDELVAGARAGVRGEPRRLGIEYLAQAQSPVGAAATFTARAERLFAWLETQQADEGGLAALLDRAVASGVATIELDAPDARAGTLASELYGQVLARAAALVPPMMRRGVEGDIRVAASMQRDAGEPVRAFADVGSLVSAETMDHS